MAACLSPMEFKQILTANDGQEAFTRLQSQPIDLLITDVRMPVMDGITLVQSIAQLPQSPPIIVFVSGFSDMDKEKMYALGVVAFLSKPWDPADLIQRLTQALADRSTLWQQPLPELPRQAILIKSSPGISPAGEEVHVGRGGFCTSYSGPFSCGKVAFQSETGTKGLNLSGEGDIRWVSRISGKIGIEFSFLDESCRARVLEEISVTAPRSFIPCI